MTSSIDCTTQDSGGEAFGRGFVNGLAGLVGVHDDDKTWLEKQRDTLTTQFQNIKTEWAQRIEAAKDKLSSEKLAKLRTMEQVDVSHLEHITTTLSDRVTDNSVSITYLVVLVAIMAIYLMTGEIRK